MNPLEFDHISSINRPRYTAAIRCLTGGLLFALLFIGLPGAALAGFEWTPPPEVNIEKPPVIRPMPVPEAAIPGHPETTNIPETGAQNPVDEFFNKRLKPGELMPGKVIRQQAAPPPLPSGKEQKTYRIVEGFGNDLPLPMVLQQIVPPGYAYSFGDDVPRQTKVSWQGDRPWNIVLQDALAPAGLKPVIMDKAVRIVADDKRPTSPMIAAGAKEYPSEEIFTKRQPPKMRAARRPAADMERDHGLPVPLNAPAPMESTTPLPGPLPAPEPVQAPPTITAATKSPSTLPILARPRHWRANKGDSLRNVLQLWADSIGVELIWKAEQDFELPQDITTKATFPDMVSHILAGYEAENNKPIGQLYPNQPDGPSVLVISSNKKPFMPF